jgi:hypothetical protein
LVLDDDCGSLQSTQDIQIAFGSDGRAASDPDSTECVGIYSQDSDLNQYLQYFGSNPNT